MDLVFVYSAGFSFLFIVLDLVFVYSVGFSF